MHHPGRHHRRRRHLRGHDAIAPIIHSEQVRQGTHIDSVRDVPHGREIDLPLLENSLLVVEHVRYQGQRRQGPRVP
jgi:ornithine cyclodeaminase/alanine dehydrogenase-like protein (mu-crystallin family)